MPRGRKAGTTEELTPEQKAAKAAERQAAKSAKFNELAKTRMSKALAAIEHLRALSNTQSYSYGQAHIEQMAKALGLKVNSVLSSFASPEKAKAKEEFSFQEEAVADTGSDTEQQAA